MNDTMIGYITGVVSGLAIATVGWTIYVTHMRHDAVDHGVGVYSCGKYGSGPTFRWTTPTVILNGK
jgi:hypothetical protein